MIEKAKWKKLGLIIQPQRRLWWMQTHAFVPFVDHVEGAYFKVYFSSRDKNNCSSIGCTIIDMDQAGKVVEYIPEPVLTKGELGCFDDSGVTPSWIINHEGNKYLYFIGWNKKSSVRMGLITGLAISVDNGKTFTRYSKVPILERTDSEPYNILTGPTILKEDDIWKMWYVSCVGWVHEDLPKYNIKYATSIDGIHWRRDGVVAIDFKNFDEHALARPSILFEDNKYKMWYSYKGESYKVGYAESNDGIQWKRLDEEAGIYSSKNELDSQMIGISHVFKYKDKKYMAYNGNNYGVDGVLLAESLE